MAYAAAASSGAPPFRRIPQHSVGRTALRRLAAGLGALAVVLVAGGSFIGAAGWMVAAAVNAGADLRSTGPLALPSVALVDRQREPLRAAGYLSAANLSPGSASVPNFNLDVKPAS